jgi:hypothetical protein
VGGGAAAGAQASLGGGLGAAMSGGLGGAQSALKGMIPTPQGMLANATGGLSQGVTMGGLLGLLCQGGIDRTGDSRVSRMVGGAYVAAALGTVNLSSNLGYAEVIGGAKLTVAATGSILQSVGGPMTTTVGGVVMRKATGAMSTSAKATTIKVGATASLTSAEKLRVLCGKEIDITMDGELVVAQGGLELKLAPAETTVKGNVKLEASDKIAVTGGRDNVTS